MARAHPAPGVTATQPLSPPPGTRQQRRLQVLRRATALPHGTQVLQQGFWPLVHTFEIHARRVRCQQLQAAGHG